MQKIEADSGLDPLSSKSDNSTEAKSKPNKQTIQQEQKAAKPGGFVIKKSADYNPHFERQGPTERFQNSTATVTTIISDTTLSGFTTTTHRVHSESQERISQPKSPFNLTQSGNGKIDDGYEVIAEPSETQAGNKAANTVYAIGLEDSLPGETINLKTYCTMYPNQFPRLYSDGVFAITNYKIIFKPKDPNFLAQNKLQPDYFQIPLGFFLNAEKKSDNKSASIAYIELFSKDGRNFRIGFTSLEVDRILQVVQTYTTIERKEYFFAFDYFKYEKAIEEKYNGWKLYDLFNEFKRQGIEAEPTKDMINSDSSIPSNGQYRYKYVDNRGGKICSTYPPYFIIPAKIKDALMRGCSQFRSKERLPVLTYYHKSSGACLYRSAQSKPGLYSNRSPEDEYYLQYLGNPSLQEGSMSNEINLQIYDARPYLSALANKAKGKGYEDTKSYKNCDLTFMQVERIQNVREAHKKLMALCYNPDTQNRKWYAHLDATEWLDLISYLLAAGLAAAQSITNGKNILVHCSDGWDRTSEISALAQILIDPYFRTIEGFEVLIEKEFLSFGFQAQIRLGLGAPKGKGQKAPVLLQFLDAVHQLIHQFPFAFEYNTKFLQDISYHSYSCQFGTFLNNHALETEQTEVRTKTVSLWSYLNAHGEKYINGFYQVLDASQIKILKPHTAPKFMRLWEENYLYYSPLSAAPYEIEPEIKCAGDFHLYAFNKSCKQVAELHEQILALKKELALAKGGYEISNEEHKISNEEHKFSGEQNQELSGVVTDQNSNTDPREQIQDARVNDGIAQGNSELDLESETLESQRHVQEHQDISYHANDLHAPENTFSAEETAERTD